MSPLALHTLQKRFLFIDFCITQLTQNRTILIIRATQKNRMRQNFAALFLKRRIGDAHYKKILLQINVENDDGVHAGWVFISSFTKTEMKQKKNEKICRLKSPVYNIPALIVSYKFS